MAHKNQTRREFIKTGLAGSLALATGGVASAAPLFADPSTDRDSVLDTVHSGKSSIATFGDTSVKIFSDKVKTPVKLFLISDTHLWMSDSREEPFRQFSGRMSKAYNTTKHFRTLEDTDPNEAFQKSLEIAKKSGVDAICHEKDIVFMVDEVQTGNGRTGKLYSYMNFGVNPDVVTTAKGIGGGLPLGACLMGEKVEHVLGHGDHGSTFGGNPVACAGAVSIINRLDDAFLAEVQRKGKILFGALEGAPGIEAVTGLGMMCGVKPVKPAADVVKKCIEKGVLCLTAKDKVRLLPALNMPEEVLVKAVSIIKEACAE